MEDLVALHVGRFFPGETIAHCVAFRITRNADLSIRDDIAHDLLAEIEEVLDERKLGACVRLEISADADPQITAFLRQALNVEEGDIYALPGPLELGGFMRIADLDGFANLKYEPWPPRISPDVDFGAGMFNVIARKDVLLIHPYESFEPVVRLIEEAADDPDVLAIKQTLYRTSRNSPIVAALERAAEKGKYVTAVIELKARFDEARNIEWAKNLERAGVQVIYGVKGLKTHAKICIIVRREPHGIVRYVHFGTGNFNEITARIYSDVSLMTSNEEFGADATDFFNAITGFSLPQRFRKIDAAPIGLRERIVEMIDAETERKNHGQKARIYAKLNSLVDPEIIESLYRASAAGVEIKLNVRGICCLRPGVPNLSKNIAVVSIIDRFLEHSRILYFHHGGDRRVFISSADWMPRNLDRRVELLVPVEDAALKDRLLLTLKTYFKDNIKSRSLLPDGRYERVAPTAKHPALRGPGDVVSPRLRRGPTRGTVATNRLRAAPGSRKQSLTAAAALLASLDRFMKTLLILRHAKASRDEPELSDHERPLADRGKRCAKEAGRFLRDADLTPDLIVSSTASGPERRPRRRPASAITRGRSNWRNSSTWQAPPATTPLSARLCPAPSGSCWSATTRASASSSIN